MWGGVEGRRREGGERLTLGAGQRSCHVLGKQLDRFFIHKFLLWDNKRQTSIKVSDSSFPRLCTLPAAPPGPVQLSSQAPIDFANGPGSTLRPEPPPPGCVPCVARHGQLIHPSPRLHPLQSCQHFFPLSLRIQQQHMAQPPGMDQGMTKKAMFWSCLQSNPKRLRIKARHQAQPPRGSTQCFQAISE